MKRMLKKSALCTLTIVFIASSFVTAQQQKVVQKKTLQPLSFKSVSISSKDSEVSPCLALLADGLRNVYTDQNGVSFFSDSKSYFSSEKFTNDYKSGKWSGGISVIANGVPLGLNAGASNDKVKQFQEKIQKATSVEVQLETFSTITRSTIDVGLAEAFNNCLVPKFGLSVTVSGESKIDVTINYKPLATLDKKPTIISVDLLGIDENDRKDLLSKRLKKGTLLGDGLAFTATRKPGEEFLIAINTSNGLSIVKRLESNETSDGGSSPIGTVIASLLDFDSFSKLTKSNPLNNVWSPTRSKWAPCDGRSIVGSKYQTVWAGSIGATAPDLRGVFLRGLNTFDQLEPAAVSPLQANPENKKRGEYQADELKSHTHKYEAGLTRDVSGQGSTSTYAWGTGSYITATTGGNETRPKNVSVYYYIRIN